MNTAASFPAGPANAGSNLDPKVSTMPPNGGASVSNGDGKGFDHFLTANQVSAGQKSKPEQDSKTAARCSPESPKKSKDSKSPDVILGGITQAGQTPDSKDPGKVMDLSQMPADPAAIANLEAESAPQTPQNPPAETQGPDSDGLPSVTLPSVGWTALPPVSFQRTMAYESPAKSDAVPSSVPNAVQGVESPPLANALQMQAPSDAGFVAAAQSFKAVSTPGAGAGVPLKNVKQESAPEEPAVNASAAKSAEPMEVPKSTVAMDLADISQGVVNKDLAVSEKPDGTSSAMQHRTMPDLNFQPQSKTEAAHATTASVATGTANSVATAKSPEWNSEGFSNGQKSGAGQPAQHQPDVSGVAIRQPLDGAPAAHAVSFSEAMPADGARQAATVINHIFDNVKRMHSDGQANMQIQVKLGDGTEVAIKLQLRDGGVQPVFKTESTELRQALERSWDQFSSQSTERGVRVTTPVFESPDLQTGGNDLNQHRGQQQHSADTWQGDAPAPAWRAGREAAGRRDNPPRRNASSLARTDTGLELYA